MANGVYLSAKTLFLSGQLNWLTDSVKVCLVSAAYTANLATHDFLADVTGIVATSGALQNKTVSAGIADADNITLSAVTGSQVVALVVFRDTGSAATSNLIAYVDTATNLPVTPNGGPIDVVWDPGTGVFYLT